MSQDKKSFILHIDSLCVLDKMTKEQAGELFKAIYEYQKTGEVPKLDFAMDIAITPFVNQFKRDGIKYEEFVSKQIENGRKGGRPKKDMPLEYKPNNPSLCKETQKSLNDSVSDSVSVNINKILLSEIDRDSLNDLDKMYFDIAIGFRDRFILNKKRLGLTNFKDQENATYKNYVEPIRLAFEKDKRTKDDFEKVFRFLTHDEFWMKNIMSTSTLKKQMDTLLLKLSNLKDKPVTKTFVKPITSKYSV